MRRPLTADALTDRVIASKYRIIGPVESLEAGSLRVARGEAVKLGAADGARVWFWLADNAPQSQQAEGVVHGWQHVNTARLIDWGDDAALGWFWVYEAHEGLWLSEILATEGVLPWRRALDIAAQILRALWHAHEHQLSASVLAGGCVHLVPNKGLTLEGGRDRVRVLGLGWGPPRDPKQDLMAVGALLFEMLTARPPFLTSDGRGIWPPPPGEGTPPRLTGLEAPKDLETFIIKLLSEDAGEQPGAARVALELVDAILEGRPLRALTDHKVMSTARNVEVPADVQDPPDKTRALDPDAVPAFLAAADLPEATQTAPKRAINWVLLCAALAALVGVSVALYFAWHAR